MRRFEIPERVGSKIFVVSHNGEKREIDGFLAKQIAMLWVDAVLGQSIQEPAPSGPSVAGHINTGR